VSDSAVNSWGVVLVLVLWLSLFNYDYFFRNSYNFFNPKFGCERNP
jgi:hypothetical protein